MRYIFVTLTMLLVFTLSGCGILLDSVREFAGYPSLELIRARKDAVKQTFEVSYDEVFDQTLALLRDMDATIYTKNKKDHSIVAMGIRNCIDTTEVGIFFVEESPDRTTVEIASYSPKAKKIVSSEVFPGLKGEKL